MAHTMLTSDRFIRFSCEYVVHFQTSNKSNIVEKKMLKEREFKVEIIIILVVVVVIGVLK